MKYELTNDRNKQGLYRIRALRDIVRWGVKSGDLGGWVASEDNLFQNGDAWVFGNAQVFGNAYVSGNAKVFGDAWVTGDAQVFGDAQVSDNAKVFDNTKVFGNARVYGDACVSGDAQVSGNARVYDNADYIVFKNWWSSGRYFTWTRSNNMWRVGCFYGTGQELIEKAYHDSEKSGQEYERVVKYVESSSF